MKRQRVFAGWAIALLASALLPLWSVARRIAENPLGRYVDADGHWTFDVYAHFARSWFPIALGVSALALACLFLDRERD